ncbi:CDT1-like protein a chloroplastic [Bienertia sinuspersici]
MTFRRFTHQHLAQLKFLLPEIGIRRFLVVDAETRCMKYDLHVTLDVNRVTHTERRKRGTKPSYLRDRIISKLLEFVSDHPEDYEIPEEELPEPFNQQNHDQLSKTFKQSSSCSHMHKYSGVAMELETAQASHFPPSFREHFSQRGSYNESRKNLHSRSVSSHHSPSTSVLYSSTDTDDFKSVEATALQSDMAAYRQPAGQIKRKPLVDGETCYAQTATKKQGTPLKSAGTPIKPVTPNLRTPKTFRSSVDNGSASSEYKTSDQPSCARSLQFESAPRSVNIELQVEDAECSNMTDILPENLSQLLKEKEKKAVEMARRKQVIKNLPKLFDRIYILFQNLKYSAIRKDALIRDLTECHSDIIDESEVEEQFKILQEVIPEWVLCKLSPSGHLLYSINKALDPNMLRLTLDKAT